MAQTTVAEFMQSLPSEGTWTLLNPDKKASQLTYRNEQDGREVVVPSIWYNQPIAWRVDYFRFCAERCQENAKRLLSYNEKWRKLSAADATAQAKRLDAEADEMERTGHFPSPVI